ncbi:IQ domain-containing protein H [Grus japonensis]|uniref:IQ domain-containing protein H n=1 Tax=Grus japonensis TaxID=30415 RepID=A0ABC9XA51_GRUJA
MAGPVEPGQEAGAVLGQVQEDLHKLKVKNTNLKGNIEAMDISDLEAAIERTELGLRRQMQAARQKTRIF